MSNVTEIVEPVGYSNLRRPKLPGFYGASAVQAIVIVGLALPGAVLVTVSLFWGGLYFLASAVVVVPWVVGTLVGRNPYEAMWRRYLWSRAVRRGQTVLSQGLLGFTPDGQTRLPGLAAQTELYSCEDVFGRPFGLLVTPSPKHYTVVISCQPPGVSGIDQKQIDNQAAHWGSWLGQLGGEPDLVGAQVVIETAPDTGHKLRAMALGSIEDDAPDLSREVLEDVVDRAPHSSAQVTTRVTLTFTAKRHDGKAATIDTMAEDIGTRLPTLLDHLKQTGAGSAVRACTAQDITDHARVAFDPSVATDVDEARAKGGTGLSWEEAGPQSAHAFYDHYVHDGAVSISHMLTEPPRGIFYTLSLSRLLSPSPKVARKRVALLYRPNNPALSANLAEIRVRQARFEASQSRSGVGRKSVELEAAQLNANDEARGAPFIRMGLLTTVTVASAEDLPAARRAIESLGTQARLKLRPIRAGQDVAFVATLPIGQVLADHLLLPSVVRDGL